MDSVLHLIGIARKAGRLEIGEEPVGAAARARQARLILVAADAAENSARRAAHFAEAGKTCVLRLPYPKSVLGGMVGRASCAMLALTDVGLASALAGKLAGADPEQYGAAAAELAVRAEKTLQRQKEQRRHEKNLQTGKKKPWAAPAEGSAAPARQGGGAPPQSRRPSRKAWDAAVQGGSARTQAQAFPAPGRGDRQEEDAMRRNGIREHWNEPGLFQ